VIKFVSDLRQVGQVFSWHFGFFLSSESEWHHERQEWLKSQVKQQPGINVSTFKTPTEVAELIQKVKYT
jgi:hypothetical protein